MTMLTNEEIKTILERSFKPFRCVVEIRNDEQIRFKVLNKNAPIYEEQGLALKNVRDNAPFTALLIRVRKVLAAKGHRLDPW
jgi:hypothetical protein